jgi:hypothetical protein
MARLKHEYSIINYMYKKRITRDPPFFFCYPAKQESESTTNPP